MLLDLVEDQVDEELAGLVLVDGALGNVPSTEEEYRTGSSGGAFPSPGVDGVRAEGGTRYTARALHRDVSGAQAHSAMGFHEGWGAALTQLVELMQRPAA